MGHKRKKLFSKKLAPQLIVDDPTFVFLNMSDGSELKSKSKKKKKICDECNERPAKSKVVVGDVVRVMCAECTQSVADRAAKAARAAEQAAALAAASVTVALSESESDDVAPPPAPVDEEESDEHYSYSTDDESDDDKPAKQQAT